MEQFWIIFFAVLAAQFAFWVLKAAVVAFLETAIEWYRDRHYRRIFKPRSSGNRQGERNWERIIRESSQRG